MGKGRKTQCGPCIRTVGSDNNYNKPCYRTPLEKPVVPSFNYHSAGDTYIDLGWEFTPGHYYYLKYGLEDNINTATGI